MICGTFTKTNIPASKVDHVVARAVASIPPPTRVTKKPDGSGTYTVIAIWPACDETLSHSTAGD